MTVDITYIHKHKDISAQMADGAYCLSSFNGNIFLNFFQEMPHIPEKITLDETQCPPEKQIGDVMAQSELPYWDTGEGFIERIFVGKIQMSPTNARLLIKNIQAALHDMEK